MISLAHRIAPAAVTALLLPLVVALAPPGSAGAQTGSGPERQTVSNVDHAGWEISRPPTSADSASHAFVGGPVEPGEGGSGPPEGDGSLRMLTGEGSETSTGQVEVTRELPSSALEHLELEYATYVESSETGTVAPMMVLDVEYQVEGAAPVPGRLVFEPAYQSARKTLAHKQWQRWEASHPDAVWWSRAPVPGVGTCPQSSNGCTWMEISGQHDAAVVERISIRVGDLHGVEPGAVDAIGTPWNGFVGNIDAVTIDTGDGPTLYDFEHVLSAEDPALAFALGAPAALGPANTTDGTNRLWRFDLRDPSRTVPQNLSAKPKLSTISGLGSEEVVVGIDFHPTNNLLYALTRTPVTDGSTADEPVTGLGRIRVIDPETFAASPLPVPDPSGVADPGVPTTLPDVPTSVPVPTTIPDVPTSIPDVPTSIPDVLPTGSQSAGASEEDDGSTSPVAGPDDLPASVGFPLTGETYGISFHPSGVPGLPDAAEGVDPPTDVLLTVVSDTGEKITIDPTTGAPVARTVVRDQSELPDGSGEPGEVPDTEGVEQAPSLVALAEHGERLWAIDSEADSEQILDVTDPVLASPVAGSDAGSDARAGLDVAPDGTLYAALTGEDSTSQSDLFTVNDSGQSTGMGIIGGGFTVADLALPPTGTVQLDFTDEPTPEDGGDATVTVERTGGSFGVLEATLTTSDGDATGGDPCGGDADFSTTAKTLSFAPGQSHEVKIPICDDNLSEGDETFTVSLTSPHGSHVVGEPSSATVTIDDDEPGEIFFDPKTYSVDESVEGDFQVSVTGDGGTEGETVTVETKDGSATKDDSDYEAIPEDDRDLDFGAVQETKPVTIPINDDDEVEGDETFTVELTNGAGAVLDTATVTIVDDPAGTISFDASGYGVAEGDSEDLVITRTDGTEGEVTVGLSGRTDENDDTADASGDDYQLDSAVTLGKGTDSATLPFDAVTDSELEGNEVVAVDMTIDAADGEATLGDLSTTVVTIHDHTTGTAFALTDGNDLVSFQPDAPETTTDPIEVEDLGDGEQLVGIDYRAESSDGDGETLFGVTRSTTGETESLLRLYTLELGQSESGSAALVAEASPVAELCLPSPEELLGDLVPEDVWSAVPDTVPVDEEVCVDLVETLASAPSVAGEQFGVDVDAGTDPVFGGETVHVVSDLGEHVVFDTVTGLARVEAPLTYEAEAPEPPSAPGVPDVDPQDPPPPGELVPEPPSPEVDTSVAADLMSVAHDGSGTLHGLDVTRDALVGQLPSATPLGDGRLAVSAGLVDADGDDIDVPDRGGFDVLGETLGFVAFDDGTVHRIDLDEVSDPETATLLGTIGGDDPVTAIDLAIQPAAVVGFTSTSKSVQENSEGSFDLVVRRLGGEGHSFAVDYTIGAEGDTATCGEDFVVGADDGDGCVLAGSLEFESGVTQQMIEVTVLDDEAWEDDEELTVTLSDPTTGAVLGSQSEATLTVAEDSVGTIGFATNSGSPDVSVDEDGGQKTLTLERTGGTEGEVVVDVTSSPSGNQPADPGEDGTGDHDSVDTTVTFPAESPEARTVDVVVHDDDLLEGPETVDLTVEIVTEESPDPAEVGEEMATLTIEDVEAGRIYGVTDAAAGSQELVKLAQPGQPSTATSVGTLVGIDSEGNTSPLTDEIVALDFNRHDGNLYGLGRSGGTGRLYTIDTAADGNGDVTATPVGEAFSNPSLDGNFFGADFDPVTGEDASTATLRVVSDADQNLVLTVEDGDGDGETDSVSVVQHERLERSDGGGDLVVTGLAHEASAEGAPQLFGVEADLDELVQVNRPGDDDCGGCEVTTVGALGRDATELAGFDTDGRGTAVAALGTSSTVLHSVDLGSGAADEVGAIEVDESDATLVGVSYAPVGSVAVTDGPDAPVAESAGETTGATVEVERVEGSMGPVSVGIEASGGVDGLAVDPATVELDDGETGPEQVTVTWADDALHEDDAEVTIGLTDPTGGVAIGEPGEVTFAVGDDDDPPLVSLGGAEVDEGDPGGSAGAVVPVRLHDDAGGPLASGEPVAVTASTTSGTASAGDDFEATTTSVTIDAGDTEGQIVVPVVGDAVDELDETFELSIESAEGATPDAGSAEVTILDDDPEPTLAIQRNARVDESDGGSRDAVLGVSLSGPSEKSVAVQFVTQDGSATAGDDYRARIGRLSFDPHQTSAEIRVPVLGDSGHEGDEAFAVELRAPRHTSLAVGRATVTIDDDDPPPPDPEVRGTTAEAAPPQGSVTPTGRGYWIPSPVGRVFAFGDAEPVEGIAGLLSVAFHPDRLVVGLASDQSGEGVWLADRSGGVYSLGSARFHGSIPALRARGIGVGGAPVVDIGATPSGDGYVLLDEDGGIHTFGDARFHGSVPQVRAAGIPVGHARATSIAVTPSGNGYVMLDEHGGVHTFGDATFHGSIPGLRRAGVPIGDTRFVSIALAPGGDGYWILDEDGGIFTFGDARFRGSIPQVRASGTPVGLSDALEIEATANGRGYWIFDDKGGVFTFGDAAFRGSVPGLRRG